MQGMRTLCGLKGKHHAEAVWIFHESLARSVQTGLQIISETLLLRDVPREYGFLVHLYDFGDI